MPSDSSTVQEISDHQTQIAVTEESGRLNHDPEQMTDDITGTRDSLGSLTRAPDNTGSAAQDLEAISTRFQIATH